MKPDISPQELRQLIRKRQWTTPTSGSASGYLQANLVMLPAEEAFNFLLFCVRNPKPCPILDVLEPGQTEPTIAPGADLRTDLQAGLQARLQAPTSQAVTNRATTAPDARRALRAGGLRGRGPTRCAVDERRRCRVGLHAAWAA